MNIVAYDYSCLMAVLPPDVSARVKSFAMAIPDSDIYEIDDEEHGRPDEIHVTVKYGLHTSDPDEVAEVVAAHDMVSARLGKLSVFNNDECIVLKVDVESEDLHELNGLIESRLQFTDTYRDYIPHVTVAYLRHREEDPEYYRKYLCGIFEGTEVWFDRLRFSTAAGNKCWIPLAGAFGEDMVRAARMRRIARRIS